MRIDTLRPEVLPDYTWQDCEAWPGRWELVAGLPYAMMPMPTIKHQIINFNLAKEFDKGLESCSNSRLLLPVNFKVNSKTILHPDLAVVI